MKSKSQQKMFRDVWNKYQDTLWRIEQSWNSKDVDYDKRSSLVDSAVEMVRIGKRLKSIEANTVSLRAGE